MVEDYDLSPFWAEAVAAYELECGHSVALSQDDRELRTADDLLRTIESRGNDFKSFREKHGPLWSKLMRFVDPITTVADLVANLLGDNSAGFPVTAVLKGISHLVLVRDPVYISSVFNSFRYLAKCRYDGAVSLPGCVECIRLDTDGLFGTSELLRPPQKSCQDHLDQRHEAHHSCHPGLVGHDQKVVGHGSMTADRVSKHLTDHRTFGSLDQARKNP